MTVEIENINTEQSTLNINGSPKNTTEEPETSDEIEITETTPKTEKTETLKINLKPTKNVKTIEAIPITPTSPTSPTTPISPIIGNHKKFKKSSNRRTNDVKHVSRKLIMAWKLASEHQGAITWREIAPVIDSVEYLSSHWKNDERLKDIDPVAIEIVNQVNKIHLELNLRVFGMNRLRIITEEFLNLLKRERDAFIKDTNEENKDSAETEASTETKQTNKSESKPLRSKEDLLDRLINSLTQLFNLLDEPAEITPLSKSLPRPTNTYVSSPPKHKTKKRNIFSNLFGSSDKKQSSYGNSTSLNRPQSNAKSTNGLEVYKNNIVSEWQEYTRKFVEPNYLFKVCKCYSLANPYAIPPKASLIGQNWICVANEISTSLWNILKKREDDLACSLIFLTLYKHGKSQVIERTTSTIGSQLPEHIYVRLEYALKLKEYDQFSKEQQLMLDPNYKPPEEQIISPVSPKTSTTLHKKSKSEFIPNNSLSRSKHDKKSKHNSLTIDNGGDDEQLSFADMLAM